MRGITATVRVEVLGQEKTIPVTVPDTTIANFGTADGAQSIGDIINRILRELLNSVIEHGKGLIPDDLLADLGGQLDSLKAQAGGVVDGLKENLGDLKKGLEDKLEDGTLEGVTDDVKEGAKEVVDEARNSLNDLLNRDRDGE